jgi:hypothetical protein
MDKRIVDYKLVFARYASMPNNALARGMASGLWNMGTFEEACKEVENEVNWAISLGYQPLGSLQIENAGGQIGSLAQPVVKYDEHVQS